MTCLDDLPVATALLSLPRRIPMNPTLALLTICLVTSSAKCQTKQAGKQFVPACIGFYNVENLFDTIGSPDINDIDFTPGSPKQWNTGRYQRKLERLAGVIGGRQVLGLSCRWLDGAVRQQCAGHLPFERQARANGSFPILPTGSTDPDRASGLPRSRR